MEVALETSPLVAAELGLEKLAVIVLACNEDNILGRCLESCRGLPIYVSVDQKTTDDTADVARQYTEHVGTHEFLDNSWAATRNAVMERVEGESEAEWFAWLDADEWWLSGRDLLPVALAKAEEHEAGGIAVMLRDHPHAANIVAGAWLNVKVLRRGVRYERRRHEVVPAATARIQAPDIVIGHEKAQRPEVIAANEALKHDLEALVADFEEFQDRRSAYYVADAYQAVGAWWDAVAWYRLGLSLPSEQMGLGILLREGLAQTYRRMGRTAEARAVTKELLAEGREGFGEVCFDIATDSHNLAEGAEAEWWYRMAVAAGDQPRMTGIGHPEKAGALSYYGLALVRFNQGRFLEAGAYLAKARETCKDNPKFAELERHIYTEGARRLAGGDGDGHDVVCEGGPGGADV